MRFAFSSFFLFVFSIHSFVVALAEQPAKETPSNALLILAKRDRTLLIVDPTNLQIVAKVSAGNDPHEVITSADGKTAYVSNYGSGTFRTLSVVDLVAQKALAPIDLGALRGPHGLAFAGGKVWFTAEGSKAIATYDPTSQKIDWILGTGQNRTHMIYVSPDTKLIVTSNVSSGTVSIIEHQKAEGVLGVGGTPAGRPTHASVGDWDETVIRVGNGSEGFDVSPDGKEIWVANAADGTVSIIDTASKRVTQTLAADVAGANRLKFTLDGKLAVISSLRSSDLVVIDTATHKTVKRIAIGHGAAGILMQPDGSRAFVACSPDGYVAVIDLHTMQITGKIEAGSEPDGMALAVQH